MSLGEGLLNETLIFPFVIRGLRKEGYGQGDLDLLFKATVLSKLTYGLSIYGASKADLNIIESFLKRCHKKRYISHELGILKIFKKSLIQGFILRLAETNLTLYIPSYRL